jgi:hypothetical protein
MHREHACAAPGWTRQTDSRAEKYVFEIWATAFCSGFRPSGMSMSGMLLRWKI